MTIIDWRLLPASTTADLYRREWIRWRRRLSWDTAPTWDTVETARVTWGLPGVVCRDASGRVRGWAFYFIRNNAVEVGAIVADDQAATAELVDALLERARTYGTFSGFIYAHAAGLEAAVVQRGVRVRPFLYLVRDLTDASRHSRFVCPDAGPWAGRGQLEAARLFQSAYGEAGRMYAPNNALPEWEQYVASLVADSACGRFSPTLSRALVRETGYDALSIVTAISQRTAHLAQIAVHPAHRRRGLAGRLLNDVLVRARQEGFTRMSLLVSAGNTAARDLYGRHAFAERETFVALEHS